MAPTGDEPAHLARRAVRGQGSRDRGVSLRGRLVGRQCRCDSCICLRSAIRVAREAQHEVVVLETRAEGRGEVQVLVPTSRFQDMGAKSTPASVDAKLAGYSNTAAMNSAIASANNSTLETSAPSRTSWPWTSRPNSRQDSHGALGPAQHRLDRGGHSRPHPPTPCVDGRLHQLTKVGGRRHADTRPWREPLSRCLEPSV